MKQLNKLQSAVFLLGGLLMVVGAGAFVLLWYQKIVCWLFLAGALCFATMQIMQTYEGNSMTVKRLKRIMTLADVFFVFAGMLMVDTCYQFMQNMFGNYLTYFEYIYNKWVLLLLIAAVLEMYTMHRISSELKKEQ